MSEQAEIEPCSCSSAARVERDCGNWYHVACSECFARGDTASTEAGAVAFWNRLVGGVRRADRLAAENARLREALEAAREETP